ncbi:MAG: hypothetical protein QM752_04510 [Gammaproteobacteria bacterium]
MQNQTGNLFLLQAELIDNKVEVSVSKAIAQVVEQISNLRLEMHEEMGGLRKEMHELRAEMNERFSGVNERLSVVSERVSIVETALGIRNKTRNELRNRFYDYAFKAGWLILGSLLTYAAIHFNGFL